MSEGRIVIVSNRVPSEGPPSGGLVVALHDCLREHGGVWFGTSGDPVEGAEERFTEHQGDGYTMRTFDLTPAEFEGYYLSYANGVLWPLCHRRADLMVVEDGAFEAYIGVNRKLARMLAKELRPDDRIWVHDYHFLPLAQCLREEGVEATIGYFHHIPFPTTHSLLALPQQKLFPGWISAFDLVGLQTKADVGTALEVFRRDIGAEMLPSGRLLYDGREFAVRSFPIGIDAKAFAEEAKKLDGRRLANLSDDQRLVIGVDRLDYSKGLPNRLRAFGRYLKYREPGDPRATFLQVAPPTREALAAYQDVRAQLERTASTVNGLYGELGWTPVNYIHRGVPRDTLAALYRAASVGMVTPLCDGMNLVAKEYVAAQDPDDPGVLILSHLAGAAEELEAALLVNPYDLDGMARALKQALTMPRDERRERYEALARPVFENNVGAWTASYLSALGRAGEPASSVPLSPVAA